ncbi:hypothetical protein DFH08DRAFT_834563 [Mycena albidolilacea]|uniref:Uncharacterized protein n=1 Tax=Mycena albidolilacea TaxID=1033008 RepID=A0AAD7ARG7_9AGAR|nr:hypothetical protein DFH08DRAFT_834563 [Mycena albidolilacea]
MGLEKGSELNGSENGGKLLGIEIGSELNGSEKGGKLLGIEIGSELKGSENGGKLLGMEIGSELKGSENGRELKGSENGNEMLKGRLNPPESVGDADADTDVGELTGGSVIGLLALKTLLALKVTVSLNGSLVGAAESLVGADVGSRMPERMLDNPPKMPVVEADAAESLVDVGAASLGEGSLDVGSLGEALMLVDVAPGRLMDWLAPESAESDAAPAESVGAALALSPVAKGFLRPSGFEGRFKMSPRSCPWRSLRRLD